MNFSQALEIIKTGKLLKRSGWNGKNQYVYFVPKSQFIVNRFPLNTILKEGTEVNYRSHIDMKYQDNSFGVWAPTMSDILADDWEIINLGD